ncbi:MAG: ABC transporter ATP-binding protein [Deltaproteobacteria bacterium HGW-Deltaproteobacteria-4]|nr:MAG: ABC transporter ATP-binding protein [Deltaproteobacteria bacterium HGW-Deltaproteobacteria-4]
MALLELHDISYRTPERLILAGLSLTVEAGEVHALLGTNGTGKSSLAYLIMGCEGYAPNRGAIIFAGQRINKLKLHERARLGIALAWQEPVRFEGLSVRDYLLLRDKGGDAGAALRLVGLEPELYLRRLVDKSLSGGERKRIELASIFALQPRCAILDEPDSGIDMLSTADLLNVINAFRAMGAAVLLITHREEIALQADRASQLCGGRIVYSGTPAQVTTFYKERRCQLCDGEVCSHD